MTPSPEEAALRRSVMSAILDAIREDRRIFLPPFDPSLSVPSGVALQSVGLEPNPYGGTISGFRYQFEGEEDLLHLIVSRLDGSALSPAEGQAVAAFLLAGVPSALIWLKPGEVTQHFYVGHDELIDGLIL